MMSVMVAPTESILTERSAVRPSYLVVTLNGN